MMVGFLGKTVKLTGELLGEAAMVLLIPLVIVIFIMVIILQAIIMARSKT